MVKFSVVVPVYNIERYLPRCLDSLITCPADSVEIICVNDGSTDNGAAVLHDYEGRDRRIRILEQQNGGLSAARNAGVKAARGEYILFVDGDDFVDPIRFSQLLERVDLFRAADVFVTDFYMVFLRKGMCFEKPVFQITDKHDGEQGMAFLPQMLADRKAFWNVWRYVYRKSFLLEHGISFQEGALCEDIEYTTRVLMAQPRMVFLHCPFYRYRVARGDSLMGRATAKRTRDTVSNLARCIKWLNDSDFPWKQNLIEQYQFEMLLTLAQYWEIQPQERKAVLQMLNGHLPLLRVGDDRLSHASYAFCSLLGVPPVAGLLSLGKRLKRMGRICWKPSEESGC